MNEGAIHHVVRVDSSGFTDSRVRGEERSVGKGGERSNVEQ